MRAKSPKKVTYNYTMTAPRIGHRRIGPEPTATGSCEVCRSDVLLDPVGQYSLEKLKGQHFPLYCDICFSAGIAFIEKACGPLVPSERTKDDRADYHFKIGDSARHLYMIFRSPLTTLVAFDGRTLAMIIAGAMDRFLKFD